MLIIYESELATMVWSVQGRCFITRLVSFKDDAAEIGRPRRERFTQGWSKNRPIRNILTGISGCCSLVIVLLSMSVQFLLYNLAAVRNKNGSCQIVTVTMGLSLLDTWPGYARTEVHLRPFYVLINTRLVDLDKWTLAPIHVHRDGFISVSSNLHRTMSAT